MDIYSSLLFMDSDYTKQFFSTKYVHDKILHLGVYFQLGWNIQSGCIDIKQQQCSIPGLLQCKEAPCTLVHFNTSAALESSVFPYLTISRPSEGFFFWWKDDRNLPTTGLCSISLYINIAARAYSRLDEGRKYTLDRLLVNYWLLDTIYSHTHIFSTF